MIETGFYIAKAKQVIDQHCFITDALLWRIQTGEHLFVLIQAIDGERVTFAIPDPKRPCHGSAYVSYLPYQHLPFKIVQKIQL